MDKSDNPFNRLYVPDIYDDTVITRRTEVSGNHLIVTDFNIASRQIVARDTVYGGQLQTRAAYDETTQACTEWHTPSNTQYFDYDAQGRLQHVLTMPRPLALD